MAIFEKQVTNKINLDDTHKLHCVIENAHNINKHTEYIIRVARGPMKDQTWSVSRRYNDFVSLQSSLQMSDIPLPLPPKKIIGNMQPGFIAQRQVLLQCYLDAIMKNIILASSLAVKIFLDPANYSSILSELALQNVSMALRGGGDFELKSPLPNIGWRVRKHYYVVFKGQPSAEEYMMTWQTYGPDKLLPERDMQAAFKCLTSLQHPYIDKIVHMHSLENGAYIIRKLHSCGSMKDHLYGTQYLNPYLAKYANPKQRKPFTTGQVAHYGYQILLALKYIHDRGLPYGHLHTGNLAIENQKVLLMDIENCILGVPSYYRQFILEHKKINNLELIDVYCFGHTLFEMAYGEELRESTCDNFPSNISSDLVNVLQMILSSSACKTTLPSVEELLQHPFFLSTLTINGSSEIPLMQLYLKFPIHIKSQLKKSAECVELRLKEDQKSTRIERRQVKIQEILNSEEELRKRKRKKKKNSALSSSHSSLNGFSQNGLTPSSGSQPGERSASMASSLSTADSITPPHSGEATAAPSSSSLATPCSPLMSQSSAAPRTEFLQSICSFNKNKLNKIKK